VISVKKLPINFVHSFQIFLVDLIGLSVEEQEWSPPLPLIEQEIPALGRAVERST
jgi:hypothetical protein